jgi:hypothetical protein
MRPNLLSQLREYQELWRAYLESITVEEARRVKGTCKPAFELILHAFQSLKLSTIGMRHAMGSLVVS